MAAPSLDDLARSFERYLWAGTKSPGIIETDLEALWISRSGPLTISELRDLLDRGARQAGIPDLHPHMFRHTLPMSGSALAGPRST